MSLERRIITVYSEYQMMKIRQLYHAARNLELEKKVLARRGNKPYARDYINDHNERIYQVISSQFLFGWWLCIKALIGDLQAEEQGELAEEILEKVKDKEEVPEAFKQLEK